MLLPLSSLCRQAPNAPLESSRVAFKHFLPLFPLVIATPAGFSCSLLPLSLHCVEKCRCILSLQAPNAPLESSRVAFKQALQLIKFTAAVNCFLPVSEASGTGGLVLLPAVLPAATAAVDYRFAGTDRAQGAAYDYYFRVQRLTSELPQGTWLGAFGDWLRRRAGCLGE